MGGPPGEYAVILYQTCFTKKRARTTRGRETPGLWRRGIALADPLGFAIVIAFLDFVAKPCSVFFVAPQVNK